MTYRMTSLSVGDRLVFNNDPSIHDAERGFTRNIVGSLDDEYTCIRPSSYLLDYNRMLGDASLITVVNTRTGDESIGYWWRFKKSVQLFQYNPDQTGDTEDDI